MKEGLYGLLDLQEADNAIDELHRQNEEFPARIQELEGVVEGLERERADQQTNLDEQRKNYTHFKQQLQATKDDLDKHQKQLAEITTNRQYEALQQEILTLKTSIDEYEMELLNADEKADELEKALSGSEEEFAGAIEKHRAEITELGAKVQAIDDEVAKAKKARDKIAETVPKRLLTMYERLRKRRAVNAVRVMRGACSGCWRSLPPQSINELKISEKVITCHGCGRILVWDDREGEPDA